MAGRKKSEQVEPVEEGQEIVNPSPNEVPKAEPNSITVVLERDVQYGPKKGERVFSKAVHGDDYEEQAEAYRKRWGGLVK